LLEPKADSVITLDQKDEWDYVLRKCFTREAQSIREALKNVGFGGEALADRLSAPNGYKGRPLEGSKIVRDLDVAEWARVVDVFDKWAFKPEASRSTRGMAVLTIIRTLFLTRGSRKTLTVKSARTRSASNYYTAHTYTKHLEFKRMHTHSSLNASSLARDP
jgi:hypothetical protein